MTRWLVTASLRLRLLVVAVAAVLLVVGVAQLRKAPVDVLPEYAKPYVEVQTESLGLSAAEVEQLITVPLEQDLLNGVQGVDTIRSDSVPGLSSVDLIFERGTDILRARQLVQERLTQAHALPNVSQPPQMIQPVSSTSRVMMIGLSSRKLSPIELSVLARWTVRPRLMGLDGVANVAIWGQRERQLQVQVDPDRLRRNNVSLFDVIKTAGNAQLVSALTFLDASTPGTGGFIDGPNQRLGIRHILPFGKPADLGQVPIDRRNGPPLRLSEVATVAEDHQPLIGDAVVNGGPGLMLVVEKLPGANTLEVTRKLERALDELRPGMAGVTVNTSIFRPATYIESAMDHLGLALAAAGALALLALAALFLQWRTVFVCAIAIPTSLITALLVLDLTGATMNALVVAGLVVALGIVIDDAISDVENISRRLREDHAAGRDTPVVTVITESCLQVRRTLGFATLIALLAMLPVFFTGGLTGAFVHPLAVSYGLAVLASLVVALTVTPALSLLVFSRASAARRAPVLVRRPPRRYGAAFARLIHTPRPALIVAAALALTGATVLALVHQSLRPTFEDRQLLVRWNAAPSTSLPEMERITTRAAQELRALKGVREVGAHIGRAVTADHQPVGTGAGQMWVTVAPSADYDATLGAIRNVVGGYPGIRGDVLTYEQERSGGVLSGRSNELILRVYGQEIAELRRQAEKLHAAVSRVPGVRAPHIQSPAMQPTLQIEVDLEAARRHGIKPGDVRRAAAALVAGIEVGSFFERQKVFQVVVRGTPDVRHSLTSVRRLLIDTPRGEHVRVGDVASVAIVPNPVDIRHDAVSRYVDVRADVRGRSLAAVQDDVRTRIEAMSFPLEYHAEVVEPADDVVPPPARFTSFAIAAAIGIFLLLQAALSSWRLAALVSLVLPLGLVDGLLVAFANGGGISLGEAIGLFTVFAITARNAMMLIARYQHLEREEQEPPGAALVLRGTRDRLPPILMTAIVTGVAMLPLAVLGNTAGNELTHGTALVVLGGLVTSTLLNLFILPALYLHYASRPRRTPDAAPAGPGARQPVPVTRVETTG